MGDRAYMKRLAVRAPAALSRLRPAAGAAPVQARLAGEPDPDARLRNADRFGPHLKDIRLTAERSGGLPDRLRWGIESLSGLPMRDVRVHYNSSRPGRLQAHAFAQGRDIHLAPGQERRLPHEAWHVVQQKQGRVRPSLTLQGHGINDDRGLEGEADAMGERARAGGSGGAATSGPALAPASGSPGPGAIQRVKWRWDATAGSWSVIGSSSSTSVAPSHRGGADGEIFDDEYRQASDPTLRPFLRGKKIVGEIGAREQAKGVTPRADKIRVPAVKSTGLRAGSGLHEVVPTNQRGKVAASKNPVLVGLQSGARTSTSNQLFKRKTDSGGIEVVAHTGFAPKPSGRGSTHTKGQGPAHEVLRETVRELEKETDPHLAVNKLLLTQLSIEPTGLDILRSPYIEGLVPNEQDIGPLGPAFSPSTASVPDSNRAKLARRYQKHREREKTRVRSHKRGSGRGRSPSPPREDIDSSGGGGGYLSIPSSDYPLEPVPSFGDVSDPLEYTANLSGWLTAPQRRGFDYSTPLITPLPPSSFSTPSPVTFSTPSLLPPPPLSTVSATPAPAPRRSTRKREKRKPVQSPSPSSRSRSGGKNRGKSRGKRKSQGRWKKKRTG
jgi:hypothetical protein